VSSRCDDRTGGRDFASWRDLTAKEKELRRRPELDSGNEELS